MVVLNWLFPKKYTLFIYMKSGNVIRIKCKGFEYTKLSGNNDRSLTIDNPNCNVWTIDIGEIEAIIAK